MSDDTYERIEDLEPKLAALRISAIPASTDLGKSGLASLQAAPELPPRSRAQTARTEDLYAVVDKSKKVTARPHSKFTEDEINSVFADLDSMASAIIGGAGSPSPSPLVAPRPDTFSFGTLRGGSSASNNNSSGIYVFPEDTVYAAAAARLLTSAKPVASSVLIAGNSLDANTYDILSGSNSLAAAAAAAAAESEKEKEKEKAKPPAVENLPVLHSSGDPLCATCKEPVLKTQPALEALNRTWHHDHFQCQTCKQPIQGNFYPHENMPYCHRDYVNLIAPKCGGCQTPVAENGLQAFGKDWHTSCFVCQKCGQPLKEFINVGGRPFCLEGQCKASINSPDVKDGDFCRGCKSLIVGKFVVAANAHWHEGCFKCGTCSQSLSSGEFFVYEGSPLCIKDYHIAKGIICFKCNLPIVDGSITLGGNLFHRGCFNCQHPLCTLNLADEQFYNFNNKSFCKNHGIEMLQILALKSQS